MQIGQWRLDVVHIDLEACSALEHAALLLKPHLGRAHYEGFGTGLSILSVTFGRGIWQLALRKLARGHPA